MKSIIKWLIENGFIFKKVMLVDGSNGLMVDTGYEGLYPTKECLNKQQAITAKVKRFKNLKVESRGYRTAILITEI
jgi:hypothetical protein